jgi:hypothetical protein
MDAYTIKTSPQSRGEQWNFDYDNLSPIPNLKEKVLSQIPHATSLREDPEVVLSPRPPAKKKYVLVQQDQGYTPQEPVAAVSDYFKISKESVIYIVIGLLLFNSFIVIYMFVQMSALSNAVRMFATSSTASPQVQPGQAAP